MTKVTNVFNIYTKKQKELLICNIAIIVMECIGLVTCIGYGSVTGIFIYYTRDSNIVTGISSICLVLFLIKNYKKQIPKWIIMLRYIGTIGVTLTFIIVTAIFAPAVGSYYSMLISNEFKFQHLVCPLISFFSFVFLEDISEPITLKDNLLAVIPTITYAAVLVILNIVDFVDGPYPFFEVKNQSVLVSIVWASGILGICYLFGFLIRKLKNKRQ